LSRGCVVLFENFRTPGTRKACCEVAAAAHALSFFAPAAIQLTTKSLPAL
jgi:hypothetical protein